MTGQGKAPTAAEEAHDGFAAARLADSVEDWLARARKLDRTAEIVED